MVNACSAAFADFTVTLDRGAFACVLGGPGRSTLFIAAAQWRA